MVRVSSMSHLSPRRITRSVLRVWKEEVTGSSSSTGTLGGESGRSSESRSPVGRAHTRSIPPSTPSTTV